MLKATLISQTSQIDRTIAFYKNLEFNHLEKDGVHFFEDGGYIIEVNGDATTRNGLKFYGGEWEQEVQELKEITSVAEISNGFVFNDLSGVRVQLVNDDLDLDFSSSGKSLLGNIAGLSLEGISIREMMKCYTILGFQKSMGNEDGGWVSLEKEGFGISLMGQGACPHMFFNPSLTYFNGAENLDIIRNLRLKEIEFAEEITVFNDQGIVDNVIVRDPGGIGFFVFSD